MTGKGEWMPTIDETKPGAKPAKRKTERKKKPSVQKQAPAPVILRTPEPVEAQSHLQVPQPLPELPAAVESAIIDFPEIVEVKPVEAAAPAAKAPAAEPAERTEAAPEPSPVTPVEPVAAEPVMATPAAAEPVSARPTPVEPAPVNMQTIANAYRDYTRKSFEAFGSYVEQLSGARSFDKAMSVQREFMKRSYETSVAETQKICDLHARLARQNLDPFRGLAGKAPQTSRKP